MLLRQVTSVQLGNMLLLTDTDIVGSYMTPLSMLHDDAAHGGGKGVQWMP